MNRTRGAVIDGKREEIASDRERKFGKAAEGGNMKVSDGSETTAEFMRQERS